jgi:hypothetical protein
MRPSLLSNVKSVKSPAQSGTFVGLAVATAVDAVLEGVTEVAVPVGEYMSHATQRIAAANKTAIPRRAFSLLVHCMSVDPVSLLGLAGAGKLAKEPRRGSGEQPVEPPARSFETLLQGV